MSAPNIVHQALQQLVMEVLDDVQPHKNPFFTALTSGGFSLDDFLETQYQFYNAVVFFGRPMASLAARIPDAKMRTEILRNVWEEHGEGDGGKSHGATFVTFLSRLSGLPESAVVSEIARRQLWPELHVFNTVLLGSCLGEHYLVGAAVLGIIEHMFAEISTWIGRSIVTRGFLKAEQMIHYNLHASLDVRHAGDFFAVLQAAWEQGAEHREQIDRGLRMGAVAFDQLYARLYRNRQRRWHSCAS